MNNQNILNLNHQIILYKYQLSDSIASLAGIFDKIENKQEDKMKNRKMLITLVISVLFWGCTEETPMGIAQLELDEADSNPTINSSNLMDGDDFTTGYYNGKIRSDKVNLEWEASTDENFLCYKIFRAASGYEGNISEGFESGSFPGGWIEYGDYGGWYVTSEDTSGEVYEGNYSIRSYTGYYGYEYIEKTITVPQNSNVFISFWCKGVNDGDGYLYVNGEDLVHWGYDYYGGYWAYFSVYYYTGSITQLTLQWLYSTENYGYGLLDNIVVSGIEGGDINYSLVETLNDQNSTAFWDTALTQNQYYTYKVANIVKTGTHKVDDIEIKTPLWQAPSNINFEILSPEIVELFWHDNTESESSFDINIDTLDIYSGIYLTINTLSADRDDTSMVIPVISSDPQYRIGIRALNSWEETDTSYSNTFEFNFNPPSNLVASQITGAKTVSLTWIDNSSLESGFEIERDLGTGFESLATVGADTPIYVDTETYGFEIDSTYSYRVRAYNDYSGTVYTDYSNEASATFNFNPPSNLVASQISGAKTVSLTWTDNSSLENGFQIERYIGTGFESLATVSTNTTSYTDTDTIGFEFDSTYSYRVRAYNDYSGMVYTDYSNEASVTISVVSCDFDETSEQYWYSSGATTIHYFYPNVSTNCTGTLIITIDGDYNSSSEYANIYVDGSFFTVINPIQNGPTTQTYFISENDLATYTYDSSVVVTVENSSSVDTGYGIDLHTVQLIIGN